MMQPPHPAYPGVVSNAVVAALVGVAIVMLFAGAIVMHYAPEITNKKYSSDDAGSESQASDQRAALTTMTVGRIVADVGAFLLILIMLLAAILRSDWSEYVRFGVLFFVAVFAFSLGFRM
jgi:ABC-type Fe3+ transport system permease subunit